MKILTILVGSWIIGVILTAILIFESFDDELSKPTYIFLGILCALLWPLFWILLIYKLWKASK